MRPSKIFIESSICRLEFKRSDSNITIIALIDQDSINQFNPVWKGKKISTLSRYNLTFNYLKSVTTKWNSSNFDNNIKVLVFKNIHYSCFYLKGTINDVTFTICDDSLPLCYYRDSGEFNLIITNKYFTLKLRLAMLSPGERFVDFGGQGFEIIRGNLESKYLYNGKGSYIQAKGIRKFEVPGFKIKQSMTLEQYQK